MKVDTTIILPKPKRTLRKNFALREGFCFGQDFLVGISLLAWVFVLIQILLLSQEGNLSSYGLGMSVFDNVAKQFLQIFGSANSVLSICVSGLAAWGTIEFLNAFLMWQVMMIAMMVPTLFVLYKGENGRGYSLSFTAQTTFGYLIAWAIFCVCAVAVQWFLQFNAFLNEGMSVENSTVSGCILIGAGLFQILKIQHTKINKIEDPYHNFQDHLSTQSAFKVGLNVGQKCVLENWPLMCIMFVFGLMNIVMMVVLTGFMVLKNYEPTERLFSKVLAVLLLCFGMVHLVT